MDHEIVEVDTVRLSPVLWNSLVSEIETTLLVFFLLPSDGWDTAAFLSPTVSILNGPTGACTLNPGRIVDGMMICWIRDFMRIDEWESIHHLWKNTKSICLRTNASCTLLVESTRIKSARAIIWSMLRVLKQNRNSSARIPIDAPNRTMFFSIVLQQCGCNASETFELRQGLNLPMTELSCFSSFLP